MIITIIVATANIDGEFTDEPGTLEPCYLYQSIEFSPQAEEAVRL